MFSIKFYVLIFQICDTTRTRTGRVYFESTSPAASGRRFVARRRYDTDNDIIPLPVLITPRVRRAVHFGV